MKLEQVIERFQNGEPVRFVAFGDSITFGSQIDPDFDHTIVYHRQWFDRIKENYPDAEIGIINRGVPGNKIADAHARVEKDAIAEKPDLILVEFGINDCWDGPDKIDEFESELRRLILLLRDRCSCPVILMTANMLNRRYTEETLRHAWFAEKTAAVQNAGWTDDYMERVRRVAQETSCPLADGYANWQAAADSGIDTDTLLVNGANHPNREGHRLLADALFDLFS